MTLPRHQQAVIDGQRAEIERLKESAIHWRDRFTTAEAERDEARARAKEAEHILLSIDEHEGLVARVLLDREHSRAETAEATVASQAVRIAELERTLTHVIGKLDTWIAGTRFTKPKAGQIILRIESVEALLNDTRTTLAAQQDQKGEGE